MPYEFSIEEAITTVQAYGRGEFGFTKGIEEKLLQMLKELSLRIARYDLEGHNSLNVDRVCDRLEAAILDVRRHRREAEEEEARRAKEERKRNGWD